jgi:hypothetical protein
MIREMSRFLSYGSIAVELNPVRQKAQLMRPRESGGASPRCRLGLITPGACMPSLSPFTSGSVARLRLEKQTADVDAKISVQTHTVADLDRRVSQI